MNDQDPITRIVMTPRSQKEANIHYLAWKDDEFKPAIIVVTLLAGLLAIISLVLVSI